MVILPLQKTWEHEQLEAIIPRYKRQDQTYRDMLNHLRREQAGYLGEQSLQYFQQLLPHKIAALYGLRALGNQHYFQIDLLLVLEKFLLIIEAKHFQGTIELNHFGQIVQTINGQRHVYQNPLEQAEVQKYQLQSLLERHHIKSPPIHTCAVFTHEDVLLKIDNPPANLLTYRQLFQFFQHLYQNSSPQITHAEATKLSHFLKAQHTPKNRHIFAIYNVKSDLIKGGIYCDDCERSKMYYRRAKWICKQCQKTDRYALIRGLKEYALIFRKTTISNGEARDFFGFPSSDTCNRRLSFLRKTGVTKNTVYHIEDLFKK
ncbi:hypothetical protein ABID56_002360 [Alkalibacillus flavidus]|uniref:NERD domain-containing protein n=1 Tax=Alkalibacillus flavidus TaxID=546021 RepID=A0ABV2KXW8_9BACI